MQFPLAIYGAPMIAFDAAEKNGKADETPRPFLGWDSLTLLITLVARRFASTLCQRRIAICL